MIEWMRLLIGEVGTREGGLKADRSERSRNDLSGREGTVVLGMGMKAEAFSAFFSRKTDCDVC